MVRSDNSCHPTQSPASSPVQIRKGRVQELLQRREVRGRGLCMPLQLHLGMSHCKPTAMPREHLLSGWLCPLAQSDWLGDRGKPASVCLRAGRRRGRAVFPHLCLWKCQNRHLASQASGLGCGWEESRHGRAGAPQGRAGGCLWLRQCGTKVSFWMCPGTQMGLDNPPWAALGFSTRHHCLPCLLNCFTRAGTCFTEGSEHTDGQIKSRAREVVPAGSLLLAGRSGRRC